MTISTTTIKNSYNGNGSTSAFNYTFKISAESEMQVIIRSAAGTETVKTLTTHYTISGVGNAGGGAVTFTAGNIPVTGETVILRRVTAQTQAMDLIDNDPMSADTIENAHDKSIAIAQELQEEVDRSIKLSRTNTMTSTEFTVDAASRANKILAFDSAGEIAVTQELGTFRGDWSASTAYEVRDLVKDTSTNNIFIATVAHTSSGSQPLTTNTDSAKWSLIVDAASATTSATTATTQAGIATTKASEASASASAALTSENNAATSETNASNSATTSANEATASANSATAAAGSASAAAATFDLFDDAYLGAKASNPTLDNDGDALQDGALYFDTTNDVMKVYNLANTTWYQLTPTVSNQNNINTLAAISGDVTQAASDSADIQTVASDSADIRVLADIEDGTTATNAVSNAGNNATSIVTVAGQISPTNNISSVAAIAADITSVANIDSDVTAVANDATDIGTVATDLAGSDNIGTVADDIVNVNLVGGSIGNVNTVGSNIGTVNEFGERYRVSATAPTTSLDVGDLYYDTATDAMKVYGSSGWQNAGSSVNGTSQRYNYTATSGQTTFTGTDNNGNTLTYDAGYIDVYLNGVKLLNGTDVTVTSGSSVVLASGATTGDVVDIVAYGTFSVASLNADNLSSGTVPDARITGAYTGITNLTIQDLAISDTSPIITMTDTDTNALFRMSASSALGSVKLEVDDNAVGSNPSFAIEIQNSEAMRINSSGDLMVGTTANLAGIGGSSTQGVALSSGSYGGLVAVSRSGNPPIIINRQTSDGTIQEFRKDGATVGSINARAGDLTIGTGITGITFTDSIDAIRPVKVSDDNLTDNTTDIGSSANRFKDLYLGGGAFIGGTGTANKLDDYEEGSFTPAYSSTGATFSYSVRQGYYTKIGNRVIYNIYIQLDGTFTGTTNTVTITGLPFASTNASHHTSSSIAAVRYVNFDSGYTQLEGRINRNTTSIDLLENGDNIFADGLRSNQLSNISGQVFLSGSYQTDA